MPAHPIERAQERYGASLSAADIASIERQIAAGRSVLVRKQVASEWHMVRHAGTVMVAVARSRAGRMIVLTFLPPDALTSGASRAHYRDRAGKRSRRPF